MVVVSILPDAEFVRNDHREDAPHFTSFQIKIVHRKKSYAENLSRDPSYDSYDMSQTF